MYNLNKLSNNSADLVHTQNMKGLEYLAEITREDYLDYMKAWSDRNPRVKNPQFHVAISCRGQERTREELIDVSRAWIQEMGYQDVPAMIFFHKDTENNHVHIVASRVGADGKKIQDSNEIFRGRAALRSIAGIDLMTKAKEDFWRLEAYKVTTLPQYSALWRSLGYRVKKKDNTLRVYKEGFCLMTLDTGVVEGKVNKATLLPERSTQIRDIIAKYKDLSQEDLAAILKCKHDLELVFYGREDKPYAYSIIDHSYNSVYKGGEVLRLKDLLDRKNLYSDQDQVERVNMFAKHLLSDSGRVTSKAFSKMVRSWGISLYKGEVFYKRQSIGILDTEVIEGLYYNDRLEKARETPVLNDVSQEVLAKLYDVRKEDLDMTRGIEDCGRIGERDFQSIYIEALNSEDYIEYLKQEGIGVVFMEGHRYLIDLETGEVEEIQFEYSERAALSIGRISDADLVTLLGVDALDSAAASSVDNTLRKRRKSK